MSTSYRRSLGNLINNQWTILHYSLMHKIGHFVIYSNFRVSGTFLVYEACTTTFVLSPMSHHCKWRGGTTTYGTQLVLHFPSLFPMKWRNFTLCDTRFSSLLTINVSWTLWKSVIRKVTSEMTVHANFTQTHTVREGF